MIIGEQLRALREQQNLSQGDIEKRTGLLRCYVSRVENGHTIPSIETLEKCARALNVLLYQVFYEGDDSPSPQPLKNSDLYGVLKIKTRTTYPSCVGCSAARESATAIYCFIWHGSWQSLKWPSPQVGERCECEGELT